MNSPLQLGSQRILFRWKRADCKSVQAKRWASVQAVRNSLKVKPKEEADFRCSRMRMRSNKEPKESKRAELRCLHM